MSTKYAIMRGTQRMTHLQAEALVDFFNGEFGKDDKRFNVTKSAIEKIEASIERKPKKVSKPKLDKRKSRAKVQHRKKAKAVNYTPSSNVVNLF